MRHNLLIGTALITMMADGATAAAKPDPAPGKQMIKIQGFDFEVPAPYVLGHVLVGNEASTLNQTFGENIRNNAASRIKAAQEAAEKAGKTFDIDAISGIAGTVAEGENTKTLRQVIDDYAATYVFGARVARSSEPADPVEREAHRIAVDTVNEALKSQNVKRASLPEGQYDAAVKAFAAREDTQKEAKRRVAERAKIGKDTLNLGDLGIAPAPAEPASEGVAA